MPGSSSDPFQKNVAVIGGGTGLSAAWILDERPEFNVTVFESNDRLGGHINSINIDGVWYEGGAEFIGHPGIYPNVHRLFNYLKVKLKEFELNMDLDETYKRDHTILPPLYHTTSPGCLSCFSIFSKPGASQQQVHISIDTILTEFLDMLRLNNSIIEAKNRLTDPEQMITLEEFVEQFINENPLLSMGRRKFADEKLYPMLAAAWGVSVSTIKTFGAHYAMHYLEAGSQWYDAPEGLSSYIHKIADECTKTQIRLNTTIKKIFPVEQDGEHGYYLLQQNGAYIADKNGQPIFYHKVLMALPAYATQEIIGELPYPEIQDLVNKLQAVKYYDTTIVLHQDKSYKSPYGTVVHTRIRKKADGELIGDNTMEKSWKGKVLKSWILPGDPMPKESTIRQVLHYRHPEIDRAYYSAQNALHHLQGKWGLHFGGLAGTGDPHESCLSVSLTEAARLCHEANCLGLNKRLQLFPAIINSILIHDLIVTHDEDSSKDFDAEIIVESSNTDIVAESSNSYC